MSPAFKSRDYVLILTHFFRLQVSENVVVRHKELGIILKKVINVCEKGIRLKGNNPLSTSSDDIGWVEHNQIIGKVLFRIPYKEV